MHIESTLVGSKLSYSGSRFGSSGSYETEKLFDPNEVFTILMRKYSDRLIYTFKLKDDTEVTISSGGAISWTTKIENSRAEIDPRSIRDWPLSEIWKGELVKVESEFEAMLQKDDLSLAAHAIKLIQGYLLSLSYASMPCLPEEPESEKSELCQACKTILVDRHLRYSRDFESG
jgi:hypothetical protein